MLWCSLVVADLFVGMEKFELHYRCRGRSNSKKIRVATISVRIVDQRAENGGLDPSWLIFAFLGRPDFSVHRSQNPLKNSILGPVD